MDGVADGVAFISNPLLRPFLFGLFGRLRATA
jgi:hypothetical protein